MLRGSVLEPPSRPSPLLQDSWVSNAGVGVKGTADFPWVLAQMDDGTDDPSEAGEKLS